MIPARCRFPAASVMRSRRTLEVRWRPTPTPEPTPLAQTNQKLSHSSVVGPCTQTHIRPRLGVKLPANLRRCRRPRKTGRESARGALHFLIVEANVRLLAEIGDARALGAHDRGKFRGRFG